jgi:crotonobetainyl-CoA:carnitine CoA-transferase CaiB-like acyl-CoA transferase
MFDSLPPGPLDGIRVLDLATPLAEAAGRVFADLGAEVIKIEPPGGCASRFTPPFVNGKEGDSEGSLFWRAWGLGKHSVVLDLEVAGDRERLLALARGADVLIESFTPGSMDALGLGPDTLRSTNPALLYVSVTPYGQHAPDATSPATDLILSAAGGLLAMQGDPDRPFVPVGFPETSCHGAVQAAADAILALYERNRSGKGQYLDSSMQAAVIWTLMFVTSYAAFGDNPPGFTDDRREAKREILPGLRNPVVEPCKDGYVAMTLVLGAQGNRGYGAAMRWVEEEGGLDPDLTGRDWRTWLEDMGTGKLALQDAKRGLEQFLAFLKTKTKAEIQKRAVADKLLIAPVQNAADLLADPQLAARDYWLDVGGALHAGPFARLSRTPIRYRRPAPTLGQDQPLAETTERRPAVPATPSRSARTSIFEGLKVLDLGWIAAGPLITKDLANLGATVLRIETEKRIDTLRFIPPFKDGVLSVSAGHPMANMNQSKLGIACDFSTHAGRELVYRMVDWADVVVESYVPGTAEKLGLGYETLRARKPGIVMISSCMRGQTGPEAKHTGFGLHGAALGGFVAITGWPDRLPLTPWGAYTDFISPRYALSALGAALYHRDCNGEGQYIDLSQIEASIHFLEPLLLDYTVNGRILERPGLSSLRACPHGVFATRGTERYVAIAVETAEQWRALREIVPGLTAFKDAALDDLAARIKRRAELEAPLAQWCIDQEPLTMAQQLRDAGVPAYVALRATDFHTDPQLAARDFFIELEHAVIGRALFDGPVTMFSDTPSRPTHAGPLIGQHTMEVLRDVLGYSDGEITELAADGVLT